MAAKGRNRTLRTAVSGMIRHVGGNLDQIFVGIADIDRANSPVSPAAFDRPFDDVDSALLKMISDLLGGLVRKKANVVTSGTRLSASSP